MLCAQVAGQPDQRGRSKGPDPSTCVTYEGGNTRVKHKNEDQTEARRANSKFERLLTRRTERAGGRE